MQLEVTRSAATTWHPLPWAGTLAFWRRKVMSDRDIRQLSPHMRLHVLSLSVMHRMSSLGGGGWNTFEVGRVMEALDLFKEHHSDGYNQHLHAVSSDQVFNSPLRGRADMSNKVSVFRRAPVMCQSCLPQSFLVNHFTKESSCEHSVRHSALWGVFE